ncbi:MAG: hypothetical protein OJF49_001193 [Ktedonobacterales bacterium]|nr:MAG: hypothetical protein OJF49_001193 [Ktedonobacterales bacterium]
MHVRTRPVSQATSQQNACPISQYGSTRRLMPQANVPGNFAESITAENSEQKERAHPATGVPS